MKKKALALALVLCMVLTMLPVTAFAAELRPVVKTAPAELENLAGKLPGVSTQASYKVSLTGGSHGTTELLVSSPAATGSEVYFLADPDDGYLSEVYVSGIDPDEVYYIGADTWGFYMPANKVTIEVQYVAAEGEAHRIEVYDGGVSAGDNALSRSSAKAGESVLLGVYPNIKSVFRPTELVWAFGADIYYLFEQDGIFYYEIFMEDEDVKILLTYDYATAHKITKDFWGGKLELEKDYVTTNKEVVFSVTPPEDYILDDVRVITEEGSIPLELTYLGEEQGSYTYSFIMPPCGVKVKLDSHAATWNITVHHNSGGVASAERTTSPKDLTVRVTCTPDEGYRVASVTGNVTIKDKGNNLYSFTMPANDVTINVTFRKIYNPVTVTVETGLGGTASVDVTSAKMGDTVTLICNPEEGYRIAQITGVKDLTDNGDNTYTFTMPDEAVNLKVLFLRHENPFLDINEKQFFYTPVIWAYENGITGGVDDTHFGPASVCNRAQVVTFLWKAAGSPAHTLAENPFEDIPETSWYTDAVLWAFENGITAGADDTHFNPGGVCNRAQVVTFLWKAAGSPAHTLAENPFEDIPETSWYTDAVLWAYENGVTSGADNTHFNPGGQCLRAHVVTFLYSAAQLPPPPAVYTVSAQFDETMGTVTLSHTEAVAGETVTAAVVPAEGYQTETVSCLSGTEVTQVSGTEYTFVMPEGNETLCVTFSPIPTEPEPTEPEPTEPAETYELDLRTNGNGEVSYVDGKTTAAPGESIFFYAVPSPGYALTNVGIFNPNNEIDISKIQLYEHGNDLYELVMIDHDIIMTCYFTPVG